MDLVPLFPGHALVVPEIHVTDRVRCPLDLARSLFEVSATLGPATVGVTLGGGSQRLDGQRKGRAARSSSLHFNGPP